MIGFTVTNSKETYYLHYFLINQDDEEDYNSFFSMNPEI